MARYKVLQKSFINNHIHGPDEAPEFREVEYAGRPSANLEYISGEPYKAPAKPAAPKSPLEIENEKLKQELEATKIALALAQAPPAEEPDEDSDDLA